MIAKYGEIWDVLDKYVVLAVHLFEPWDQRARLECHFKMSDGEMT